VVNVIIFGPPGAGKGTQAQNIVNNFNLHQLATGGRGNSDRATHQK